MMQGTSAVSDDGFTIEKSLRFDFQDRSILSRTAAWAANWKWKGGTAPTLSTAAASVDRVDYIIAASGSIHAVATLDVK